MKHVVFVLLAAIVFVACQSAPTRKTDSTATIAMGVSEMSPQDARPAVEAAYSQFIDVRTPGEFAFGHAYRTRNIPLDSLMQNLDKLEKNEPVFIICQSGKRSMKAAHILNEAGFTKTVSIAGGTTAWQNAGLPMAE